MALTATCDTFNIIMKQLSLKNPLIMAVSPNRPNIKLSIKPSQPLEEFAMDVAEELKVKNKDYPKTIIFRNCYNDCSRIYERLLNHLGKDRLLFEVIQICLNIGYSLCIQGLQKMT